MTVVLAATLLSAVGALGFYAIPRWWRSRAVSDLRAKCSADRILVLTYDDGPADFLTPKLIALFERFGRKATFFAKGVAAEKNAGLLDALTAAGHEIGCHSHAHLNAWKVLPHRALRDAMEGYATLSRWVPADGFYRSPYGKTDLYTSLQLSRKGIEQAWWTIDSGDTWAKLPDVDDTVHRVREAGGGVILLHDMHSDPARQRFVLELTERLLECIEAGEFVASSFGSLIDRPLPQASRTGRVLPS